jgi:hypothetical protein
MERVLKKAALSAFKRLENRERDSIQLEKCESSVLKAGYRLAPRLYAHRTVQQIAKKIDKEKFYLRYATDEDKNFALDALSKLHRQRPSQSYSELRGSHTPTICFFFDVHKTIRGLLKMGLNLVAAACKNTLVGPGTFPQAVRIIRDIPAATPQMVTALLAHCGFVHHGNVVTSIAAPNKAHSFVITYCDGLWHVYSSFFGGRMRA